MTPKSARGRSRGLLRLVLPAVLAAVAAAPGGGPGDGQPRYTAAGALFRPETVDRWILVGTSLGLGYSDDTEAGPGMFHRVYLEPTAYDHYLRTGRFREGTMLALVIRRPAARIPPGKSGWTEGDLAAVEMAVKDPGRFAGGWAYFDFGRSGTTAAALPPGRCARCHAEHAARDNVFLQFYPQLRGR
jgi:hypothetical protein